MNICLASIPKMSPLNGGVENVCYNLAQAVSRREGIGVFSLYAVEDASCPVIPAVRYCCIPGAEKEAGMDEIAQARHFIDSNQIDIVWVHTPGQVFSCIIREATRGTSAKIVSIYHSAPTTVLSEIWDRHAFYWYRCLYHREILPYLLLLLKFPLSYFNAFRKTRIQLLDMLRNSDVVALLSEYYIDEFVRLSGCSGKQALSYVTNPLMDGNHSAYDSAEKKKQLLVVCRHEWKNKRLDRILRIWKKIQQLYPDWNMMILGDGPAHQEYEEDAKRLGLQRITFAGKQCPDAYYAESRIICMTSSWEGLPMVLIEAQRFGCVPIAYESFSGLRDIIVQGETGYSVTPFLRDEYIARLSSLMTNQEKWLYMSQQCRKHSRRFDIEPVVDSWLKLFGSLQLTQ